MSIYSNKSNDSLAHQQNDALYHIAEIVQELARRAERAAFAGHDVEPDQKRL